MKIWIDAQLSPTLADWLNERFEIEAKPVRDLGLRHAEDSQIFQAAREASAVVMSKDADFVYLNERHGLPPQVLWITCGNTSNTALKSIFERALPEAIRLLEAGEPLVEISDVRG